MPEYALRTCVSEFHAHTYRKIITTGGPTTGRGPVSIYNTMAHAGSSGLQTLGVSPESIQVAPALTSDRDRTYSAAAALRDWFHLAHLPVRAVNVMTLDVHARRTRLLYEKALGPHVAVGVISIPSREYPARKWFRYSEGVKEVISESAAYLYVRLFFYPDK
jgi:hypothetical protein